MKTQSPSMERIALFNQICRLIDASPAMMLPEKTLLEGMQEKFGIRGSKAEQFLYLGPFVAHRIDDMTFLTYSPELRIP